MAGVGASPGSACLAKPSRRGWAPSQPVPFTQALHYTAAAIRVQSPIWACSTENGRLQKVVPTLERQAQSSAFT